MTILDESDLAEGIPEIHDALPAMAVEMAPKTSLEDALARKHVIVGEPVHEQRAPAINPLVHDGDVDAENEAMAKRPDDAVEVTSPLQERTARGRPRIRARGNPMRRPRPRSPKTIGVRR